MSVRKRDPLTGHETTGHEWNGITELNTRVPRVVWFFIIVTHLWALLIWLLLPSWPLVTTYTKGLLGIDQRQQVEQSLAAASAARADWVNRVAKLSPDQILDDPELSAHVVRTAHRLFGDNCATCHGSNAAGAPGIPSLIDNAWLWGGDTKAIMETLRVGINAQHPNTRVSQMAAFGRDNVLTFAQISAVTDYVYELSNPAAAAKPNAAGAKVYAEHCASCHGNNAKGKIDLGAPDLTDKFWMYGGSKQAIFESIWEGRKGQMPAFENRLSITDRKILAVYLQYLRKEAPQ